MIKPLNIINSTIKLKANCAKTPVALNSVSGTISDTFTKSTDMVSKKTLPFVAVPIVAAIHNYNFDSRKGVFSSWGERFENQKEQTKLEKDYPHGYHIGTKADEKGNPQVVKVANLPLNNSRAPYGTEKLDLLNHGNSLIIDGVRRCPYAGKEAPADKNGRVIIPEEVKETFVNATEDGKKGIVIKHQFTDVDIKPESKYKFTLDANGKYPECPEYKLGKDLDIRNYGMVLIVDRKGTKEEKTEFYKNDIKDILNRIEKRVKAEEFIDKVLFANIKPESAWKFEKDEEGCFPNCMEYIHFLPDGAPVDMRDMGIVLTEDQITENETNKHINVSENILKEERFSEKINTLPSKINSTFNEKKSKKDTFDEERKAFDSILLYGEPADEDITDGFFDNVDCRRTIDINDFDDMDFFD